MQLHTRTAREVVQGRGHRKTESGRCKQDTRVVTIIRVFSKWHWWTQKPESVANVGQLIGKKLSSFYREVKARSLSVRVGMESSGHGRWFERLLRDLQFELWIGDVGDDDGRSRFGVLTATCAPAIARPDLSLTLPEIVPPASSWRLLRFCRAHSPCRRSSTARSYRNKNAGLVGPADSCSSTCGETTRF
jgi:hypothetical protein